MKFRKRTPTVDAVQWDGRNEQDVLEFTLDGPTPLSDVTFQPSPRGRLAVLIIETGIRREAAPGDWIVREPTGRFYPVKQEVFVAAWEPAPEPTKPEKSHNVVERMETAKPRRAGLTELVTQHLKDSLLGPPTTPDSPQRYWIGMRVEPPYTFHGDRKPSEELTPKPP